MDGHIVLQCPGCGPVVNLCDDEDVYHHAMLACSRFKAKPFSQCHQTVSAGNSVSHYIINCGTLLT